MEAELPSLQFTMEPGRPEPLYLQFKEQLKVHIRSRKLAAGTRLPDIKTLARMAGISVKTANSGLNELLRERVCVRRPKKGTFVAGVSQPSRRQRKKICMLYHREPMTKLEHDDVRVQLHHGIQSGCRELGIDLLYLTGDPVESIDFYRANDRIEVTGMIMLEATGFEEDIRLAQIYPQLRFVYFNDYNSAFENTPRNVYGVFHDDFSGGYQAGSCLAAQRPGRLGLIALELDIETYSKRAAGFRMALTENGYDPEKDLVEQWERRRIRSIDDLRAAGRRMAGKMLSDGPCPDAVFVVNDVIAEGVNEVLRERGCQDRVILFGYDNIFPEISRKLHFSTISVDFPRMGRRAIELIAASTYIPKVVFLPPQMICRLNPVNPDISHDTTATF